MRTEQRESEPVHLALLRVLAMAAGAVLFASTLGGVAGMVASATAVVAAHLTAARLSSTRVRGAVVALGIAGLTLLGLEIEEIVGGSPAVARSFGITGTLVAVEVLTFGLLTFSLVLGLRWLARRWSPCALLEVAALGLVSAHLFQGHRDFDVARPRFLSDWAWSRGHDPMAILLLVGVVTLGIASVLLLSRQSPLRTLLTVLVLAAFAVGGHVWMSGRRLVEPPAPRMLAGASAASGEGDDGQEGAASPQGGGSGKKRTADLSFTPPKSPKKNPPTAVVTFHEDFVPPSGIYYFRQTAFSHYNGTRLVRATRRGCDDDVAASLPVQRIELTSPGADSEHRRTVPTTVTLMAEHPRPFALGNATAIEARPNPDPRFFRGAYRVTSRTLDARWLRLVRTRAGDRRWSVDVRTHYTEVPKDPRFAELARRIVSELGTRQRKSPVIVALALRRWLEKNVIYSKAHSHAGTPDPTAAFLFGNRSGYCVHIAHAMAFLMRTQQLPARVCSGYAVPASRRGRASSVIVQGSDAHAWAELYLEGVGWVTMDVSPERSEEPPSPPVDQQTQSQLGEMARGRKPDGSKPPEETPGQAGGIGFWTASLSAVIAVLALGYAVKLWRSLAPCWTRSAGQHRVAYRAALDRLAELGLVRGYGETREEFARRLSILAPELAPLTRTHERGAAGASGGPDRRWWSERRKTLARQLAQSFGPWRRFAGFLDPTSWLRTG